MRLSKKAIAPVSSADSWKAIVLSVVLVAAIGFCQAQHWHIPNINLWFWCGTLFIVWAFALFAALRFGWRVFRSQQGIYLAGYTLFAGGHLLPHLPAMISWLPDVGLLAVLASMMFPYLEFGKRGESSPGENHPKSAV